MKILCKIQDGGIYTASGDYIGIIPPNSTIAEHKETNNTKDRVKQALKLKDAGFTGKEIIDIIGEIEC